LRSNPDLDDNRLAARQIARTGKRLGHTVIVRAETGSTNDDLREKAEAGAPEGLVLLAEAQTAGRGRLRRRWESPAGKNLLLSVLLRPALSAERAFQITLMTGVAVAQTLAEGYGLKPRIKWPNDVMVQGRKLCGVLAEMKAAAGQVEFIVLGLGVNLNLRRTELSEELQPLATSVAEELGRPVARAEFARALLEELETCYLDLLAGNWPKILEAWHSWAAIRGQEVLIELNEGKISGAALGLDQDGALRVWDRSANLERRILAGDVKYLREKGGGRGTCY